MNRRQAREQAFILIFQYEFRGDINEILGDFLATYENIGEQEHYIHKICEQFVANKAVIDELIEKHSQNWKKDRISMVSLAALRLALCEILHFDDIPTAVSIAEALEVVKKFEGEDAIRFINGILDSIRAELGGESAAEVAR